MKPRTGRKEDLYETGFVARGYHNFCGEWVKILAYDEDINSFWVRTIGGKESWVGYEDFDSLVL